MKPKISVIVPVYNVEHYLNKCLDSLLKQQFQDFEVLLINDGSTDNSGEICNKYASEYADRFRVYHKENGGLADARNRGLVEAESEYVCFVDSDDWVEPEMLKDWYEAVVAYNADIVISGIYVDYINENYTIKKTLENMICTENSITNGIINCEQNRIFNPVTNKLYRSELLRKYRVFFEKDGMPAEDLLFNCQTFKLANSIVLLDKAYYHYLKDDRDTLVSKYYSDYYEKVKLFIDQRNELYKFFNINDISGLKILNQLNTGYLFEAIKNLYKNKSKIDRRYRIKMLKEVINSNSSYFDEYGPSGIFDRIMIFGLKLKNFYMIDIYYSSIFAVKNIFTNPYKKIRKINYKRTYANKHLQ